MGNLYIVATPIGNLQDITQRALSVLSEVDYIVSEDTRKTGNMINLLGIKKDACVRYISYFEHNEEKRIPEIIELLERNLNIALVSDSGTPLISDPGFKLVRECKKKGINVIAVPGPSSVITSLVVSGLPTDKFIFLGFLPKSKGKRTKILSSLRLVLDNLNSTVIIFESPHRIFKTLQEIQQIFGDINVVVSRELTKIHEETRKNKISLLIDDYKKQKPRGEIVLLFNIKES